MNYWGIQKRILMITLLPCLLTALVLGGYFIQDRFHQQHTQFLAQSTQLTKQLALQAYPLFEQDTQAQEKYLMLFTSLSNIRGLALLTADQQTIASVGPSMHVKDSERLIKDEVHIIETGFGVRLLSPVFNPDDKIHSQLLGWVELEFKNDEQLLSQITSLFSSVLLVLVFCLLAIYMSYRASTRITRPLQHAASTLDQLGSGNLNARISQQDQTEFNELATGINSMAASLQSAQQELQDNVEQATEDLKETLEELEVQNIELSLARKSALDASKTKSEFLANMSHEIRTPLNGIIGFTNLLEKTRLNKRQQDYLQTIEASSSSLLTIINDILDFSKIEAGKLVLDSVPVHLRDITDEVLTMLAPEAHKKGIELAAMVYQDVPFEIMADPVRLKQVLTNLVSNAVKFTESGSVVVRIMLEEQLNEKVALKVTVTDTGIGLTQEQSQSLFNAFTQADASTTRRFGGTGLGLVISQHLVDHMHGEIGVTSQSGAGSQFWFTGKFDVCDAYMENWNDAPWFGKQAFVHSQWDTSGQILNNQLHNLGFNVKSFNSIQELLSMQTANPAELCLLDIDSANNSHAIRDLQKNTNLIALLTNNDSQNWEYLESLKIENSLVYPISFRRLTQLSYDLFTSQQSLLNYEQPAHNIKVLAVDDNEPNLELICAWLDDLNIEVVKAHGGLSAVKYATEQTFDLIFMDIQMPDLDGVQATEKIREKGLNQNTPLVALTAHALATERKNLLKNGFDDYLTKPLSEEQLVHTMTKWTNYNSFPLTQDQSTPNKLEPILQQSGSNPILDWPASIKLAGGKLALAQTMVNGLFKEINNLYPVLVENSLKPNQLLEPIHKLHGLCKYVAASNLLHALELAETTLKSEPKQWALKRNELIEAIDELMKWKQNIPEDADLLITE